MSIILVANPKGGSGKTTISTNMAGFFSQRGDNVVLSDLDRQRSSINWLDRRPKHLPLIRSLDARKKQLSSDNADWTVIDSPAGLHGEKLSEAVKEADWVIVPIQPSAFDMGATQDFIEILREEKAVRKEKTFVAMVGMRVDQRTKSALKLQEFLEEANFPVMTYIRDTQTYARAAEEGISIFDMRPSQVKIDLVQWAPLTHWLLSDEHNS